MIIIGVSGPSCSGKSTLARHLRLVLPNARILYEDDFYHPESQLPLDAADRPNWDCPESFDLIAMRSRIQHIKTTGESIDQETREEHNNNHGKYLISESQISELKAAFAILDEPVLVVDGILLFHKASEVADVFDLKIMFPFIKSELKARRESRSGYATSDGFWTDPPNYFDELVWPEFVKHCGYLYVGDGETYTNLSKSAELQNIWMPHTTDMYTMLRAVAHKIRPRSEEASSTDVHQKR